MAEKNHEFISQEKQVYNSKHPQYKKPSSKRRLKQTMFLICQYLTIPNITIVITLPS